MGRILVIRGGAIGDFILTLPVLAALRAQFPDARVEVLSYPHIGRLAVAANLAHAVHPIESRALAGFFARNGTLDDSIAAFLRGFAVIISFLFDPDGIFKSNVCRCTKAQFIAGPHRPSEAGEVHAVDTFLTALQPLAIFESGTAPVLPVSPMPPGRGTWLAAHPGSGSDHKNWPEARWIDLLDRVVRGTTANVLLLGGEAEGDRLERLARTLPSARVALERSRPLDEVAMRLRGCQAFVGHDSGITHLAAAVQLPSAVLWGPSNLRIWQPRGEAIRILQDPRGLPELPVDEVWDAVNALLSNP